MSDNKKVKCLLTKHEIPCTIESIKQYTEGGKFKRLYKQLENQKGTKNSQESKDIKEGTGKFNLKFDKYKEFFVESKKSSSRLFCTLTRKEVNKLPHELESDCLRPVAGKRSTNPSWKMSPSGATASEDGDKTGMGFVPKTEVIHGTH